MLTKQKVNECNMNMIENKELIYISNKDTTDKIKIEIQIENKEERYNYINIQTAVSKNLKQKIKQENGYDFFCL